MKKIDEIILKGLALIGAGTLFGGFIVLMMLLGNLVRTGSMFLN